MYVLVRKVVDNIGEGIMLNVAHCCRCEGISLECTAVLLRGLSKKIIGHPTVVACNQSQCGHGYIYATYNLWKTKYIS